MGRNFLKTYPHRILFLHQNCYNYRNYSILFMFSTLFLKRAACAFTFLCTTLAGLFFVTQMAHAQTTGSTATYYSATNSGDCTSKGGAWCTNPGSSSGWCTNPGMCPINDQAGCSAAGRTWCTMNGGSWCTMPGMTCGGMTGG